MKTIITFILLSAAAAAQATYDTYGGVQQSSCTGGATGYFYTEKVGSRWWLCTPSGNHYFFQGVGGANTLASSATKYGSLATWANQQVGFIKSVGFNGIGELSDSLFPTVTGVTNKAPFFQTIEVSLYATVNLWSYAARPTKNYMWGQNGWFTGYQGAGCIDAFDPEYSTFARQLYLNDAGIATLAGSPYFIGVMNDDTDFVCGFGATPDLGTVPAGVYKGHLGYITMLASPLQRYNPGFTYNTTSVQYTDAKVYSKTGATSPPTICSISTPCTLRDYLAKKYGTISGLNTAWGTSNYYTTFDSAGTSTSETCATGDGSTKVFTCTLSHGSISPFSAAVSVGGTMRGGDCPWFQSRCNVTGQSSTPYSCGTAGNCRGSFGGDATTTISAGTAGPWLQSGQLSSADCGGACALLPATYWVRTTWHGCTAPSLSREIGSTYATGHPRITITTQNNAADNPGCATGVDIYVSCRMASGAAANGCVAASDGIPPETLQASNVAYPGGSWVEPLTGLVSGAALPSPGNVIDYGSGAVQLTFDTAPSNGAAITISYTYGGWMFGTGLMDEDGRHTTWLGTEPNCVTTTTNCTSTANANVGADLDAWQAQYAGKYFSLSRDAITNANTTNGWHMLYFGNDTLGDWYGPPRKEILQGAAQYLDATFSSWSADKPNTTDGNAKYQYVTHYFGDKPLLNFLTLEANADSAMASIDDSNVNVGISTQAQRAAEYYATVNAELNSLSYNNTHQYVGVVWWGLYDYSNEGFNWGLRTVTDNAYNAHDAISGSVACAAPLQAYTCGSEPAPGGSAVRPFGDLFGGSTGLTAANALWINVALGVIQGQVVSGKAIIHGKVRMQ